MSWQYTFDRGSTVTTIKARSVARLCARVRASLDPQGRYLVHTVANGSLTVALGRAVVAACPNAGTTSLAETIFAPSAEQHAGGTSAAPTQEQTREPPCMCRPTGGAKPALHPRALVEKSTLVKKGTALFRSGSCGCTSSAWPRHDDPWRQNR